MLPLIKNGIRFEEKTVKCFNGINTGEDYATGDICDEINMSSKMHPSLCTRNQRIRTELPGKTITGTGNHEGILYTYTTTSGKLFLHCKDNDYEFTELTSADKKAERKFSSLGDSVLIIPDKLLFIPSEGKFRKICVTQSGNQNTAVAKFALESQNSDYLDYTDDWYLGYVSHNKLTCRMVKYANTKQFYFFSFDRFLKSGDIITLKMSVKSDQVDDKDVYNEYKSKMKKGMTLKIKDITVSTHNTSNGTVTETVALHFDDYAIDTNDYTDLIFDEISIERSMPDLKDICSFNNRIWGITDTELKCSRLGDASEWNDFTTDSYGIMPYACFSSAAPTEGSFTSVITFGNYVYAFKENTIHKLYGDKPDEFTLKTVETNGVPVNKINTVAKSDSAIFYCSFNGIYKFDGNITQRISQCLDKNADYLCGVCDGEKYYVYCTQDNSKFIYVYDIRRKIWHRESIGEAVKMFCRSGNDIFAATDIALICLNASEGQTNTGTTEWNFTIKFDEKLFEKKTFSKLSVRYSMGDDAFFTVRAIYDDGSRGAICGARHDEAYESGGYMHMPLKRCRSFRLQFRGKGFFCLKSLRIRFYRGSEI